MRNELLLSILIPVYNVEEYLPDCLDSCLDQGLNETEYEIICVDDGSTDHSLDVLSAYAASHKNIIVLSKENGGVSSARNYALDHARGKYVWFVDSDDYLYAGSAAAILNSMERYGAEQCVFSYKKGTLHYKANQRFSIGQAKVLSARYTTPSVCSWIFCKNIIDNNNLRFCLDLKKGEDTFFVFQYYMKAEKTLKLDSKPYYYRVRIGSTMHTKRANEHGGISIDLLTMAYKYQALLDSGETPNLNSEIKQRKAMCVAAVLFDAARCKSVNKRELLENLEKEGLYPYKPLFFTLKYNLNLKHTLIEYTKFLFPCRAYYLLFSWIIGR